MKIKMRNLLIVLLLSLAVLGHKAENEEDQEKAHKTYLNELGPGQYNLPPLTGRHSLESKRRNHPYISISFPTKTPWNAEYH